MSCLFDSHCTARRIRSAAWPTSSPSRRSGGCARRRVSTRGFMSAYHTTSSYFSAKQGGDLIAAAITSLSPGSCCRSARAAGATAIAASAAATSSGARVPPIPRVLARCEARAHEADGLGRGKFLAGLGLACPVLEPAGAEPALGHDDAVRNAEELRIGELDAGPRVPVVEQHLDVRVGELAVEPLRRLAHRRRLLPVEADDDDLEGRERRRPDDAALVVVLLDRRGDDARDADAVAAHVHLDVPALLVLHASAHRLAVLLPELEYVTDFDSPRDREPPGAARARVAVDGVAQVRDGRLGQVAPPVDPREVCVRLVRAADEVRDRGRRVVGDHGQLEAHRTEKAGL